MKRSIKGYENMSHHGWSHHDSSHFSISFFYQELMDILRLKKASGLPAFSVASPSKKKVKSNAVVQDDDTSDNVGNQPRAGSSNGRGTREREAEIDKDRDTSSSSNDE
jgi:hypothetical protein